MRTDKQETLWTLVFQVYAYTAEYENSQNRGLSRCQAVVVSNSTNTN